MTQYARNLLAKVRPACDHTHMFTFKGASMCACTWLLMVMEKSSE